MSLSDLGLETSQHSAGTQNKHEVDLLKDFVEAVKIEYLRQLLHDRLLIYFSHQTKPLHTWRDSTPTRIKWSQIQPLTNKLKALQNVIIREAQLVGLIKYILQYVEIALNLISSYEGSEYKKQKQYSCVLLSCIPEFFKPSNIKNIFVEEATVQVFDLFMYGDFTMTAKKELIRMFNAIATGSNKQVRIEVANNIIYYMYKLLDSLSTFGDYEIQSDVMETLFRIFGSEITKSSSQYDLLPGSDGLGKALATDISINNFDTDVRRWLNKFNSNSQSIFSIACKALMFGNITCKPSEDYNGVTWVDFNLKENMISFFSEDLSSSHWNRILIITKDVRKVEVKRQFASNGNTTNISMQLLKPCISEVAENQEYWDSLDKCFKMIISNEEKEKITRLISQILPRLFGDTFLHTSDRISGNTKRVYKPLAIKISKRKSIPSDLSSATTKSKGDSGSAIQPPMHRAIIPFSSPACQTKSDEESLPDIKISVSELGPHALRRGDISPVITDFSRVTSRCEVTSDRASVITSNDSEIFANRARFPDPLDDARALNVQGRDKVQDNIVTSSHKADDVIISPSMQTLSGKRYSIPLQAGIPFYSPEVFSSSPVKHSRLITQDFTDDTFHSAGSDDIEYTNDDVNNQQFLEGKVSLYKVSQEIIEDVFETAKEDLNDIAESELLVAAKDSKKVGLKYKKIEHKFIECVNLNLGRTSESDTIIRVETLQEEIAGNEITCSRNSPSLTGVTELAKKKNNDLKRKLSSGDKVCDESFRYSQAELITPPAAFGPLNLRQGKDKTADVLTPDLFEIPTQRNEMNVIASEKNYSSQNNSENIFFRSTQENKYSDNLAELSLAVNVGISDTQHSDEVLKTSSKRKTVPIITTSHEENKENIIDLTLDDDGVTGVSEERDTKAINVQSKTMLNTPELLNILATGASQVITSDARFSDIEDVRASSIKIDIKKNKSRRLIKTGKKQFRLDNDSDIPISDHRKGRILEEGARENLNVPTVADATEDYAQSGHLEREPDHNVATEKGIADDLNTPSIAEEYVHSAYWEKKSCQDVVPKIGVPEAPSVCLENRPCPGATEDLNLPSVADNYAQSVDLENEPCHNVTTKTGVGEAQSVQYLENKPCLGVAANIGVADDLNEPSVSEDLNLPSVSEDHVGLVHLKEKPRQEVAAKEDLVGDLNVQSLAWEKEIIEEVANNGVTEDLNVSLVADDYAQSVHLEKESCHNVATDKGTSEITETGIIKKSNRHLIIRIQRMPTFKTDVSFEIETERAPEMNAENVDYLDKLKTREDNKLTFSSEASGFIQKKAARRLYSSQYDEDVENIAPYEGQQRIEESHTVIPRSSESEPLDEKKKKLLKRSKIIRKRKKTKTENCEGKANMRSSVDEVIESVVANTGLTGDVQLEPDTLDQVEKRRKINAAQPIYKTKKVQIDFQVADCSEGDAHHKDAIIHKEVIIDEPKEIPLDRPLSDARTDQTFVLSNASKINDGIEAPSGVLKQRITTSGDSKLSSLHVREKEVTARNIVVTVADVHHADDVWSHGEAVEEKRLPRTRVKKGTSDELIVRKSPDDFDQNVASKSNVHSATTGKSPDLEEVMQQSSPILRRNKSNEPVIKVVGELPKTICDSKSNATSRKLYRQGSYSYLEGIFGAEQAVSDRDILDVTPVPIEKGTKIPKQRKPRTKKQKEEDVTHDKSVKEKSRRSLQPTKNTTTTEAKKRRIRKKKEFGLSTTDFKSLDQLFDISCRDIINRACGLQQDNSYRKYDHFRRSRPLDIVVRSERQPSSSEESPEFTRGSNIKGRSPDLPKTLSVPQTPLHSSDYSWPDLEVEPFEANAGKPQKRINILQDITGNFDELIVKKSPDDFDQNVASKSNVHSATTGKSPDLEVMQQSSPILRRNKSNEPIKPKRLPTDEAFSDRPFKMPKLNVGEDLQNMPLPSLSEHRDHPATGENVTRLPTEKDISEGGDTLPDRKFMFTLIQESVQKLNIVLRYMERFTK